MVIFLKSDINDPGSTRMSNAVGAIWTNLTISSSVAFSPVTSVLSISAENASQGLTEAKAQN